MYWVVLRRLILRFLWEFLIKAVKLNVVILSDNDCLHGYLNSPSLYLFVLLRFFQIELQESGAS